jgi:DNA polymerase epsilon subunit 1
VFQVTVSDDASVQGPERSGLDLYFSTESGKPFKATILFRPYFYVVPDTDQVPDSQLPILLELLTSQLLRLYEGSGLYQVETVYKQDLDQPNHLSPSKAQGRAMLKLVFDTTSQLSDVRHGIRELVAKNVERGPVHTIETSFSTHASNSNFDEPLRYLTDMREYDVPYTVRVCTDLDIRAGTWYTVNLENVLTAAVTEFDTGGVTLTEPDRESKADPVFLAFDIECTKAPLKFPSAEVDEIFMISYMLSTPTGPQGYLIVSRSVVSADVQDFEYTPKPDYPGPFHIFNEANEKELLTRFFAEFRRQCPQIVVTYNGDFFDWPFVDARAKHHGLDLFKETGVEQMSEGSYRGRWTVHLDAFHWVQRDSYLPQGAQGLKAVTKYKLGYDPVEVDPEDMVRFAQEKPVHMATYSVSDAVATYYLYEKYVHLFIFSLSTIIPMGPEDVLGKGSGTLCEALLMVQACQKDIICPNKQTDPVTQFHNGHLLESETYIGGKVECLETGVYRSDLEYEFDLNQSAFQQLIDNIDRDLNFAIEVEGGQNRKDIVNYDEVRTVCAEGMLWSEIYVIDDLPQLFSHALFDTGSERDCGAARDASRSSKAHRETIHLPLGRWSNVPQHYSHQSTAAKCHSRRCHMRGLRL